MATTKAQDKSFIDRALDRISPQPTAPARPEPPRVNGSAWEDSVDSHKINTLTVHQVGLIVFGETQSVIDSDTANDTIVGAREKVAHVVINGDEKFGRDRPLTALPIEPSKNAMRNADTRKAYDSSLAAAREAFLAGSDPTHGATHLNLRIGPGRYNFKAGNPKAGGFTIKTQSGPFDNLFPTSGKGGLPAHGIYINTYGND